LSHALHFGVVAAGLLLVCARDLGSPDRPRLEMLIGGVVNCHYSAHDLSRCRGEGPDNFGRFNMRIEMGMALFHAVESQRTKRRCAFFVSTPHSHGVFASDLAGLDPLQHGDNDRVLVGCVYEWLRDVVKSPVMNRQATTVVQDLPPPLCLSRVLNRQPRRCFSTDYMTFQLARNGQCTFGHDYGTGDRISACGCLAAMRFIFSTLGRLYRRAPCGQTPRPISGRGRNMVLPRKAFSPQCSSSLILLSLRPAFFTSTHVSNAIPPSSSRLVQ
jgi:hypothetical protein